MNWTLRIVLFILILGIVLFTQVIKNKDNAKSSHSKEPTSLVVLWTSGERDVAEKMVFMYGYNAIKYDWWKEVTILIWGPSGKLLVNDSGLQKQAKEMQDIGVHFIACKGCSDQYGISEKLSALGVEVKYIGKDLTEIIKSNQKLITL